MPRSSAALVSSDGLSSPRLAGSASPVAPRALRVVLVVALDRQQMRRCLSLTEDEAAYWPSTLYSWAAETAIRSPRIWDRCEVAIERALAPWLPTYARRPAASAAELLTCPDASGLLTAPEIATVLWTLLRRREAELRSLTSRLAMEAEVLVARSHSRARVPSTHTKART